MRAPARLTRAAFLRTAAAGTVGLAAAPTSALAGTPIAPAPDDLGFLQWGASAELARLVLYDRILHETLGRGAPAGFAPAERAQLKLLRASGAEHLRRLRYSLGTEAPRREDFQIVLPEAAFRGRAAMLALAERFGVLLGGLYLAAAAELSDPGTRSLLAQLLASESQHVAALSALRGVPVTAALPVAIDLAAAGDALDAFLAPGTVSPPPIPAT